MEDVTRENVKEGEFFKLKGDDRKEAYQVSECWDGVMTVAAGFCPVGECCMTKKYSEFERVTDFKGIRKAKIHYSSNFEDNRTSI